VTNKRCASICSTCSSRPDDGAAGSPPRVRQAKATSHVFWDSETVLAGVRLHHAGVDETKSRLALSQPGCRARACTRNEPFSRRAVSCGPLPAKSVLHITRAVRRNITSMPRLRSPSGSRRS
jgi:hypothetical protein